MSFNHIILSNMAYIPEDGFLPGRMEALQKELTIYNRFNIDDVTELYDNGVMPGYIGIPLFYFKNHSMLSKNIIDRRVEGLPVKFAMKSTSFPDQQRILDEFSCAVDDGITGFILNAPPGWGKTRTGIAMCQILGRNALIVVPRSNLVDQWKERILQHTDIREDEIGIFNGGKAVYDKKKCKITIGLVHTLALERFHKYANDFGVIFFDEVHMSVPPKTFAPVAKLFAPKYRIGVSATLSRDDGLDKVFFTSIEQHRLVGSADSNRMKASACLVDYSESSGRPFSYENADVIKIRANMISLFAKNKKRTQTIAHIVMRSVASGRRTCVISDRTSILLDLHALLSNQDRYAVGFFCSSLSDINGNKVRSVSKKENETTLQKADIILATYGLMSTGTDIPDLATIILATPQSKVQQTMGRVERVFAGKKPPVVMDIVDTFYDHAKIWAKKRGKEYKTSGMKITQVHFSRFLQPNKQAA